MLMNFFRRAGRAASMNLVRQRQSLCALMVLGILAIHGPATAQTFADDARAAAAKGTVTLNDIPAIKKFLSSFGARKLGTLKLNNATFDGGVLKADVKFININWRFTAYSDGTLKDTFFTFGPTSKVSFKKVSGKARQIAVDRNGAPWVINQKGAIFAWDQAAKLRAGKLAVATVPQLFHNQTVMLQMQHSKRCLDNSGSTKKGTQAWQWDCKRSNTNQQWRFDTRGGGWFRLVNARTKMCLDVSGNSKKKGAKTVQWSCHKNANQLWRLDNRGKGYFRLVSKHANKCLDVSGNSKNAKARFQQWDCHNGGNQLLKLY